MELVLYDHAQTFKAHSYFLHQCSDNKGMCIDFWVIGLCQTLLNLQTCRRWQTTGAEPPPAGGHLPSVGTSSYLRSTRDSALRTPGLRWIDDGLSGPPSNALAGRETRKMNMYQAVRDAMR